MSLLSVIVFVLIVLVTTVKTEVNNETAPTPAASVQNFKEFFTNAINKQSQKIQTLFKKIQTNAQSLMNKIESIKQDKRETILKKRLTSFLTKDRYQVEAPQTKRGNLLPTDLVTDGRELARSYSKHYQAHGGGHTGYGYGATSNANYNLLPTMNHHHSFGFDPINIVVSVSLLSFLLQAITGLLSRTRLPTPVVEARNLNQVEKWFANLLENNFVKTPNANKYSKRKRPTKYNL